jgi:DNA modification methylase
MGEGTTGCACIKEQRNFIGIELNENYFNTSVESISSLMKKK